MITRTWKVYGMDGHRQKESFNDSYRYDFSKDGDVRIIEVENADKTGTNDYTLVRITRDTAKHCEEELEGQLTDGIFENYRTGRIEEVEGMKVYFENTNAYRNVIFTDGETAKIFNGTGDGKFDGIYLYGDVDQVIEQLKKYFAEANLNDYDEINGDLTIDYEDLADGIDDMVEIY